jgi:hypothetical protein
MMLRVIRTQRASKSRVHFVTFHAFSLLLFGSRPSAVILFEKLAIDQQGICLPTTRCRPEADIPIRVPAMLVDSCPGWHSPGPSCEAETSIFFHYWYNNILTGSWNYFLAPHRGPRGTINEVVDGWNANCSSGAALTLCRMPCQTLNPNQQSITQYNIDTNVGKEAPERNTGQINFAVCQSRPLAGTNLLGQTGAPLHERHEAHQIRSQLWQPLPSGWRIRFDHLQL